jgi:hypothetical protein
MYANVRGLVHLTNYEQADKYFAEVPPHSRSKKYQPHQRTLKPQRPSANHHYRIERHNDGEYYDLILYQTVMARYYKPNPDGSERRLYNGDGSQTSKQFMWNACGVWNGMKRAALGRDDAVVLPLYRYNALSDKGAPFCADLTLVKVGEGGSSDMAIDTTRSEHTPHYRYISSKTDKQQRARVRQVLRPFLDLMHLRMPEFVASAELEYSKGRPFGGAHPRFSARQGTEGMMRSLLADQVPQEADVAAFFELCQTAFDGIASKRGYEQKDFRLDYWTASSNNTVHDLQKPITEKELEKSVLYWVNRLVGTNRTSEKVLMPQFVSVNDYPRKGFECH